MKTRGNLALQIFEHVGPWIVLALLLTYSYAKFFRHSYGFRVSPSTGLVVWVFDKQPEPTLKENDRILQIGITEWEDFRANLHHSLFEGYVPGNIVPLLVERHGQQINISWRYPESNPEEFQDQFQSEWWLAYFFWLAGILTVLLIRPKDEIWVLLSLFNFLTAIWLSA